MSTDNNHNVRQFPQVIAPYCIALEKSVGALVFREREGHREYLLMQYPHGHWEFPRGHVEGDETEEETMFREIEEETGLTCDHLRKVEGFREKMCFSYMARGSERIERKKEKRCLFIRKTAVFYLVQALQSDVSLSHEHKNFVWLRAEEAIAKLTFENARRITRAAERHLQKV